MGTDETHHVSDEALEKTIKIAGNMRRVAFQAAAMSYMALRHETPDAPTKEMHAAVRSINAIVYPGGAGCEKWRFDDESQDIVPVRQETAVEYPV